MSERQVPTGKSTQPHVTASALAIILAFTLLALILILAANGVINEGNAASFAAAVAAVVAVFGLAFKLITDELIRQQSEMRARLSLAIALHAEISSNLDQQRRTLDAADVAALIERKLVSPVSTEPSSTPDGEEHSAGLADFTDPIFAKAIERYDLVPETAIHAVIDYYNLNQMLNTLVGLVSSRKFLDLKVDQRATVLKSYFVLADRTDAKACEALAKLASYVNGIQQSDGPKFPGEYEQRSVKISAEHRKRLGLPELSKISAAAEPEG